MLWWTLRQLQSKKVSTRLQAAASLGHSRDARAVKPLVSALQDDSEQVVEAAAQALGLIGDRQALRPLMGLFARGLSLARRAVTILSQIDPQWANSQEANEVVAVMIATLGDQRNAVRAGAAHALKMIGDGRAVPALLRALVEECQLARLAEDWLARAEILEALNRLDSQWTRSTEAREVLNALGKAILEGNLKAREDAAFWLTRLGVQDAITPLAVALADHSEVVREAARSALKQIDENWRETDAAKAAIQFLVPASIDDDDEVRASALSTLTEIAPDWQRTPQAQAAVPALIASLGSRYSWRRQRAFETLRVTAPNWMHSNLARSAIPPLIAGLLYERAEKKKHMAAAALHRIAPDWERSEEFRSAVPMMSEALLSGEPRIEEAAIEFLGKTGAPEAVEPLLRRLWDSQQIWDGVVKALQAIAEWGGTIAAREAVPRLIENLKAPHPNEYVIERACWALGEIKDASAGPPLLQLLGDPEKNYHSSEQLAAAARALGKLGDLSVIEPLASLAEKRHEVALVIVEALLALLAGSLAHIPESALRCVANLTNVVQWEYGKNSCYFRIVEGERAVDCSSVRQLARQELLRRGIEA